MLVNERQMQAQGELINAGFRPERFGGLVKFVRRFLWPFIRPFHFYQLDRIVGLELEIQKRGILAEEQQAELKNAIAGELEKLVREHVLLRSEMEALKNRYISLESLDDRVNAFGVLAQAHGKSIEEIDPQIEKVIHQITAIDHQIEVMGHQLQEKAACEEVGSLRDLVDKIPPRELAITSTKFGLFIGKPGEIISDHIFRGGIWDQHILDLAWEVYRARKGRALDVGAHLGSVTIALATLFDEVISFEPNDFNFKILNANVAINSLQNIRLFNSGVYSREARLALGEQAKQEIEISVDESGGFDGHSAHNLGAYLFSEQRNGLFGHDAKTIDSYNFEDVSFIKIDVQGADGEVLMGAWETIRRCQSVVVFEWEELLSRNFNVTFDSIVKSFSDIGYEVNPLKVHNEKQVDYVARPMED